LGDLGGGKEGGRKVLRKCAKSEGKQCKKKRKTFSKRINPEKGNYSGSIYHPSPKRRGRRRKLLFVTFKRGGKERIVFSPVKGEKRRWVGKRGEK